MDRRKLRGVTLPRRSRSRRLLELGKDILIVCLILSAVYLAARSQLYTGLAGEGTLFGRVAGLFQAEPEHTPGEAAPGAPGEALPAVRLAICHGVGDNGVPIRCGVQYDEDTLQPIVAALSGFFTEGLASAAEPRELTPAQWQEALRSPGVCLDLLGAVPLDYLGADALTQSARRLALVWDGVSATADLCYQEAGEGRYYRCATTVNWKGYLADALQSYNDNGARYAFELEEAVYDRLEPEVLLLSKRPGSAIYQAVRPLDLSLPDDRAALENAMGFRGSDYQVPGEWVIREDDELRIASDGTMHYEAAGNAPELRYPTAGEGTSARSGAIAAAYRLGQDALTAWCGGSENDGQLILSGVTETEEGWEIALDYTLDGALVLFEDGRPAMEFTASGGQIAAFTIRPRCYQATEHVSQVLSERLAAAALESLRPRERLELLLFYEDSMNAMPAQWGGF